MYRKEDWNGRTVAEWNRQSPSGVRLKRWKETGGERGGQGRGGAGRRLAQIERQKKYRDKISTPPF
jgi:hypothetical protein